jgi:hypothetical protein
MLAARFPAPASHVACAEAEASPRCLRPSATPGARRPRNLSGTDQHMRVLLGNQQDKALPSSYSAHMALQRFMPVWVIPDAPGEKSRASIMSDDSKVPRDTVYQIGKIAPWGAIEQ